MAFPTRLLVATDFSPCSQRALDAAVHLAASSKAEIVLLHAFQLPVLSFLEASYFPSAEEVAKVSQAAQNALADAAKAVEAKGLTARTVLRDGNSAEEIVGQADELGCDMIVVGTHGRSALGRALLGSVAQNVVRLANVPVLTVRMPD